jgi:DNA polymerase-3 subunit alpha
VASGPEGPEPSPKGAIPLREPPWYIEGVNRTPAAQRKPVMEFFAHASLKESVPRFTHLKVYSSYTLGVGVNTPAEICAHAARAGYRSVGLTDIGGTYGFIEFHLAAKESGIKPIYGVVVRHHPEGRRGEEPSPVALVAVSPIGLGHVAALASLTVTEEGGAALDTEFLSAHSEGVVAFMGAAESEIGRLLREGSTEPAERVVASFKEIYGDRLFIEVQDHGRKEERTLSEALLGLAARTQTAPLLTHEAKYTEKKLRDLYGTLRGIRHPTEERDFFPSVPDPSDWSLRTPNEMLQLRPFYEAAFDNAAKIDDMIPGDLMEGLLDGGGEPNPAEQEKLRREILDRCANEFRRRYGDLSDGQIARYREILAEEVEHAVAEGNGPSFLLFHGLMSELRDARVETGPATGLGLQSLCAYLLGITSFDPYHYDHRFHPGFDRRTREAGEFELQLTTENRAAAVHALFAMLDYGRVAYLPAIERVTPVKAVRMAATVAGVTQPEADEIQEIIGRHPGVPLERIYEVDARLKAIYTRSLGARDLLVRAALLEDLPVGFIRSRRSLAVSPVPLTDFLGCSIDSETGDLFIQAGRENFPLAGVYRVDVTSLGALGVCVRSEEQLREAKIADYGWDGLSINEEDVWREVQSGDSTGIFLFEGPATAQLRSDFPLGSISDLTNFLALMRSRDGELTAKDRLASFLKASVEPEEGAQGTREILAQTNGQVLYHEQVRDIISALTGAAAAEAWRMVHDLCSASPGELSTVRSRFMVGAADSDLPMDVANRWFEWLLRHARTTISRKRVFADALLVYKLFFLKTRHEPWFDAALLNTNLDSEGKLEKYLGPLGARGMILGVDVNRSQYGFTVEDGRVRSGFCVVGGIDEEKSQRIVKTRTRRDFDSLEDFVRRVGGRHLDRADVRRLIEAGAFDEFEPPRDEMVARLTGLMGRRTAKARADGKGQLELPLDT